MSPSARGTLDWRPTADHPELLAPAVAAAIHLVPEALVAESDASLADTAAFCAANDVALAASANCVVVAGRRGDETRTAAVMVLATHRADVNGVVRKRLDARKASFAPMDEAVPDTGMEFGGITPVGLPEWPILVDDAVAEAGDVVIGAGIRGAKLLVPAAALLRLPLAERLELARPVPPPSA